MNIKDKNFVEKKLGINSEILNKWNKKLQIKNYKIGELILNSNKISESIFILLEGKIRIRGITNKNNQKILSLGVLESFQVIGISSNRIKEPIEIVSAFSDCVCLSLPFKEWKSFRNLIHKDFFDYKEDKLDLSEIWYLLNNVLQIENYPQDPRELKRFLKNYQDNVLNFNSYSQFKNASEFEIQNYQWISLEKSNTKKLTYKIISSDKVEAWNEKTNFERIIGFPNRFNAFTLLQELNTTKDEKIQKNIDSYNHSKLSNEEESLINDDIKNNKNKYRFFSSQEGLVEETTACFQMLASMLNIPLRKESVKKIIEENINKKTNDIGLDLCAAIAESLGLKTQLAKIPLNLFQRSLTPLFIKSKTNKIFICFDVNEESAIIGDPNDEIKEVSLDKLEKTFGKKRSLRSSYFYNDIKNSKK